jgi:hypothetical protein
MGQLQHELAEASASGSCSTAPDAAGRNACVHACSSASRAVAVEWSALAQAFNKGVCTSLEALAVSIGGELIAQA